MTQFKFNFLEPGNDIKPGCYVTLKVISDFERREAVESTGIRVVATDLIYGEWISIMLKTSDAKIFAEAILEKVKENEIEEVLDK